MKIVRHIALLLFTLFTVYGATIFVLSRFKVKGKPAIYITNDYYTWKGGDTYQKFAEFGKAGRFDVIVVGSSRAYRGYSPQCFDSAGYTMFNLGSSAQSIHNTYYIVRNYIDSTRTRLLIVDLFAGAFRKSQLESSSDLIENVSDPSAAMDIALHTPDARSLNLLLLRELTEKDAPYFSKKDYSGNGFSINTDSLPKKLLNALNKFHQPKKAQLDIDDRAMDCFESLLTYCSEKGVRVIAVYSPVSDFYSRADHQVFIQRVGPLLTKHQVPFYDYSDKIHLSTTNHFYDDTHLNLAGVKIFNARLLSDLAKDRILQ